MKKILFLFAFLVASCTDTSNPPSTRNSLQPTQPKSETQPASQADDLTGSWTGKFGPNKITIVVDSVHNGQFKGRSIVAGNDRPFSGTMIKIGEEYQFEGREPGDDPNDGIFKFKIDPTTPDKITGTWTPFKRGTAKTYELTRRTFTYVATAGNYPETSARILKQADVENRPPDELRIMRNEIYARHGYNFKMKDMRSHFDEQEWYMPWNTDVRGLLTETEKKNESLLKQYEKYNAEFYDSFGR
ncbi:MAG: YARHG domain-containing protein [Bacteroidetes Order II. Incertae sedis bacterium]|nr:YARHG domain-containing protein [Bacteroidetes Order II. bacterium]